MELRSLFLSRVLLVVAATTLIAACDDAPIDEPSQDESKATITLSTTAITAAAEGGEYEVNYSVENGFDGIEPVALCDDEWVKATCAEGVITIDVKANTTIEERTTELTIKYPDMEQSPVITIEQDGATSRSFEFVINDMTSTGCKTTIKPTDNECPYIVYMSELSYFSNMGIETAEQLFEDDYAYFAGMAEQYESNLEAFMMMNAMAFTGEGNVEWTGMMPNREYIIYAYNIEFNEDGTEYTLASPISYKSFTLPENKLSTVEFDVNITVNGPEIEYEFAPIDWDGAYYIDIYSEHDDMYRPEGELPSEDYTRAVCDVWLSRIQLYMASGYSGEELIRFMCLYGPDSYTEIREADTAYMMVFYAIELIDGIPQVVSEPQAEYFRTGVVEQSDMTIELTVENAYVRVADLSVKPSKNDPYTLAVVLKSDVPEGSDEDIINWLTGSFGLSIFEGNVNSHLNTLDPETEYSILAFGYFGGIVTTELFRIDFKTEAEGECENSVLGIEHCGPYSPLELGTALPDFFFAPDLAIAYEQMGYYMMWVELKSEKPTQDIFCAHFDLDKFATLGHAGLFDSVVSYSAPSSTMALAGMSGVEFVLCGVVMDYRGNYSDMWLSEPFSYTYNESTKRPINELIEKLSSETRSGKLMLVGGKNEDRRESFVYLD